LPPDRRQSAPCRRSGAAEPVEDERTEQDRSDRDQEGDEQVMTALRVDTLPTTILYNSQGEEVWRMTGMSDWLDQRAARLLLEADAG
jgi:hypothetical protein